MLSFIGSQPAARSVHPAWGRENYAWRGTGSHPGPVESPGPKIDQHDLRTLLHKKPDAGIDMLAILGRQFHAAQDLVRVRSLRDPNEVIEQQSTLGDRIADGVARFGGSWRFIISFGVVLAAYTACNVALGGRAWDPYPFILLNLFLSMLAAIQAPVIMMSQNRPRSAG